jgi:hypothetical protein
VINEAIIPGITPEQLELALRLESIFMPYAQKQRLELYGDKSSQAQARFVHYTSAEAALSIIKSKRIWMRNTNCMSDYREVQHGFDILSKFFADNAKRGSFMAALDDCAPGVAKQAIDAFNQSWNNIRFNTYITAISEHDNEEDSYGRLSMWRAFGGNTARVGIVFNVPSFSQGSLALNLLFSPVAYLTEPSAHNVLNEVIENVHNNRDYLRTVDHLVIARTVFLMILADVLCLKHRGFHEEREWRAIYAPKRWPSPLMESSTELIGGIPQIVHKIPLDARVSQSLEDLELSRIFDRLIIGPSPYPWPMYEAFVGELKKAGVEDAEKRVVASDIPIRA